MDDLINDEWTPSSQKFDCAEYTHKKSKGYSACKTGGLVYCFGIVDLRYRFLSSLRE